MGGYLVLSADTKEYNAAPHAVDILEAFLGAVYRRAFFDDAIFQIDPACRTTDDIWISQHLAERGVARVKLPAQVLLTSSPDPNASPPTHVLGKNDAIGALRANNVFGKTENVR